MAGLKFTVLELVLQGLHEVDGVPGLQSQRLVAGTLWVSAGTDAPDLEQMGDEKVQIRVGDLGPAPPKLPFPTGPVAGVDLGSQSLHGPKRREDQLQRLRQACSIQAAIFLHGDGGLAPTGSCLRLGVRFPSVLLGGASSEL